MTDISNASALTPPLVGGVDARSEAGAGDAETISAPIAGVTAPDRAEIESRLAEFAQLREAVATATKPISALLDPLHRLSDLLESLQDELLERYSTSYVGKCEFCNKILLAGDRGHSCEEGYLCEECAPTWGELKQQYSEAGEFCDDEDREDALRAIQAHVDTGGSLDDKRLWVLG